MTRAREAARLIGNNTFRLDSNNAVGFNSTTPDAMFDINHGLTVAGVSTFTGNVTMEGDLTVQGTTTTLDTTLQEVDLINVQANASVPAIGVTQSGSGNLASFYDGTKEVFRIADGGSVGINTTSPTSIFDVELGTGSAISFAPSGAAAQINFKAGTSNLEQAAQILVGENGGGGDLLLKTKTTGGTLTTRLTIGNDGTVSLPDNGKLTAGADDDLQIYHDGGNSRIVDSGTGSLVLASSRVHVLNAAQNAVMLNANDGGSIQLYHNGSEKLETTSTGIEVTGSVTATSFSGNGANLTGLPAGFTELDAALFN